MLSLKDFKAVKIEEEEMSQLNGGKIYTKSYSGATYDVCDDNGENCSHPSDGLSTTP